jgi:hypothetical protein
MWQALIPALGKVLEQVLPDPKAAADAKLRLMELAQRGELAVITAETDLAKGQLAVNQAEAQSSDFWRGGWRPAVGWTCCGGLAYTFIVAPLLPWLVAVCGASVPPLPTLDMEALMALLFGMLGLGGMRTAERIKGVIPRGR